ncbi:hypothetical protein [Holophaga foetida]|uniref:hypothetical protein n=1 Tax=Holophaga foetida TaxID=35839 RepID=UPI0011DCC7E9|nr:hypothetical protein [Holophaga foetida]
MYQKLVPFDGQRFNAVDPIALRRTAQKLIDQLPEIPEDDPYEIRARLIPTLRRAIAGQVQQPIKDELELIGGLFIHERREGIHNINLGLNFSNLYAKFAARALALPLDSLKIEMVNGQQCAWADFEEEGDWPNKVKYP